MFVRQLTFANEHYKRFLGDKERCRGDERGDVGTVGCLPPPTCRARIRICMDLQIWIYMYIYMYIYIRHVPSTACITCESGPLRAVHFSPHQWLVLSLNRPKSVTTLRWERHGSFPDRPGRANGATRGPSGALPAPKIFRTESVCKVVFKKSIPARILQLIAVKIKVN